MNVQGTPPHAHDGPRLEAIVTGELPEMHVTSRPRRPRRRRTRRLVVLGGVLGLAAVVLALIGTISSRRAWTCVSAASIQTVSQWSSAVARPVRCALLFTDDAPNWSSWSDPWILGYRSNYPKFDWTDWYGHGRDRRHLIVTQNLIPQQLQGSDWLAQGASGAYEGHARALARNLVRAGMGNVVIRLAHEANGNWYDDSIPATASGDAQWIRFWDNTVSAMRSVAGADFTFDWCVNAGYRDIPLADFYPGDRYVNVIGVDAYDSLAGSAAGNRVKTILGEPDGLYAVRAFARAHHKPLSIPEWGIGPAGQGGTDGDDPAYVSAIAHVVKSGGVLYQSLFTDGAEGKEMLNAPKSLRMYRRAFGG
jgi:hypothetical protein